MPAARNWARPQATGERFLVLSLAVRTTIAGRVGPHLTVPVAAPAVRGAVGRETARVEPSRAEHPELVAAGNGCGDHLHARIAVAQLAKPPQAPAVGRALGRDGTRMPAPRRHEDEVQRVLS